MKVLITGAGGFLGRHVTEKFVEQGFDVTGFDLTANPGFDVRWIVGDLRDRDSVMRATSGHDAVMHLGAVGDVYLAAEQPSLAAEVNVVGSSHIAEAALAADAKVVYASTWEVYGKPEYEPIDEDHPCNPDHPYSITKLAGERLLLAADAFHEVPVTALRLGTSYGQGLRSNSVFSTFIEKARKGEPVIIQGDGLQARQFTHARDLARAFILASTSSVHGVALNAVDQRLTTIKELAECIIQRSPSTLSFTDPRTGDPPTATVSAKSIEGLLGWRPQIDFEEGLQELL